MQTSDKYASYMKQVHGYRLSSDEPPRASIEPQQRMIKQGSNVTVECEVTGSPTPTIRWSKVRSDFGTNLRVSKYTRTVIRWHHWKLFRQLVSMLPFRGLSNICLSVTFVHGAQRQNISTRFFAFPTSR